MAEVVKDSMEGMPERELLAKARKAAEEFASFSQEQVDKIVDAVVAVAAEKAEFYAEWAVRETGFGSVEHKSLKNQATSVGLVDFYKDQKFAGYQVDEGLKIVSFARPAGVVLGVVPCTNPVATIYFKTLIALMGRNTIVFCPHPAAKECCVDAADVLAAAAVAAGGPKDAIQVLREPSIPVVDAMMKSDMVNVILATGGPAMVRAAYSSGNPAVGVGPGNVAHYIDDTTNLEKAAGEIVFSSTFDHNLLCTCESVVLAKKAISDQLSALLVAQGTHFVKSAAEVEKLRNFLYPEGKMNPGAVGKSARYIAEKARIVVPESIVLLAVEIQKIDAEDVFSCEKMFPVVGYLQVEGLDDAMVAARLMIKIGGKGHSAAIHSEDNETILTWSALDVCRVAVNGPAVLVSAGLGSGLNPTATLGTGFYGRSSIGDNVGPMHLVQWSKVAYAEDIPQGLDDALAAWKTNQGK